MRRSANKATCDMWIMRHKLRLRSKLACFEFNQEKVCSTRANLYTLSVETNPKERLSQTGEGGKGPYHPYHTSISVFPKCEWRMSGRTKRRTVKRKSKRLVDYRSACKESGRIFFFSDLSACCALWQKCIVSNSISAMYTRDAALIKMQLI